ncbi:MAG: penicillin acylase family protein [Myxococcota bacterium]
MRRAACFAALCSILACSEEDPEPSTGSADMGGGNGSVDMGPMMDMGQPPLTGIELPGTTAPVQVDIDAEGVPHIQCQVFTDCLAAQGYVQASQRFGQMDFRRRVTSGRLTELFASIGFGSLSFGQDLQSRAFFRTTDGSQTIASQLLASSSQQTRDYFQAYADGVNAWIEDFEAGEGELSFEWRSFADQLEPWTAEDSLSVILLLIEGLTNSSGRDLAYGTAALRYDPATLADLFSLAPATTTTIIRNPGMTRTLDPERAEAVALSHRRFLGPWAASLGAGAAKLPAKQHDVQGVGSNSWAVQPSAAGGGTSLLANDPHLGMSNPSTWYVVHLASADGVEIAGASFAGLPGVVLGQNRDVAWGATNSFFDQADVYLETLTPDRTGVVFNGEAVPFEQVTVELTGPDGNLRTETLFYVPHHGPVVDLDLNAGQAVTIRWTGQDADTDADFLTEIWTASTIEEARTAISRVTTVGQNFTVIDNQGNIGWFPYNRVPRRTWASAAGGSAPWAPLPGDGSREWEGFIPLENLPQLFNPDDGWFETANNDMTGHLLDGDPTNDGVLPGGGPTYWQNFLATGYRAQRIDDLLDTAAPNLDAEAMASIQADVRSNFGSDLVPAILAEVSADNVGAAGERMLSVLQAWDFTCPTGLSGIDPESAPASAATDVAAAEGCAAFHALIPRLNFYIFSDEQLAAGVTNTPQAAALVRLLTAPQLLVNGEDYFDDISTQEAETKTEVLALAIDDAAGFLTRRFGAGVPWTWGTIHTVEPDSDDGRGFEAGPYANDGGWYTVDVANPSGSFYDFGGNRFPDSYQHGSGPSMRLVCRGETPVRCTIELPGSQPFLTQAQVRSPANLQAWVRNESFPIRLPAEEFQAASVEQLSFIPGGS